MAHGAGGTAAAAGIALINSMGNVSGFVAPYVTGWLKDGTGSEKAGLWLVGAVMLLAAVITVALGKSPRRDAFEEKISATSDAAVS